MDMKNTFLYQSIRTLYYNEVLPSLILMKICVHIEHNSAHMEQFFLSVENIFKKVNLFEYFKFFLFIFFGGPFLQQNNRTIKAKHFVYEKLRSYVRKIEEKMAL